MPLNPRSHLLFVFAILSASAIATAVFLISSSADAAVISPSEDHFIDDNDSVHEGAINAMADAGFVRGCNPPANDRFCPNRPLTRGELATILVRAKGWRGDTSSPFVDIGSSVHRKAIAILASRDVARGCNPPTNNQYCPQESVTRGQVAAFLRRTMAYPAGGPVFADSQNSTFRDDIGALAARGILRGCNPTANTRVCPNRPITRGELATVIVRALDVEPLNVDRSRGAGTVKADVRFRPGDDVARIVANSPRGTVFVFSPGVYERVSVQPRSGQVFVGEPGAVLRGGGAEYAFRSGETNVTIRGLTIEGYRPKSRDAVIQGARGWTIDGNVIRDNGEKGVHALHEWRVVNNTIHRNGRYGLTGYGRGIVVSGNEISHNSTDYGATGDSGGTKFVHTEDLVLRNNYVHNNYGNGLWVDINNLNALIEGNRLISNRRAGVFIEISCGGTIRNNTVEKNGFDNPYPNWMGGSSGIQVSNTPNVRIYGNRLSGNAKGIGALQVDHKNLGAVDKCQPQLKNLRVYDNVVTQSGGAAAGLDANNNRDSVWSSWGNRFEGNTYNLSNSARFRWEGDWISHNEWTNQGNS